jgi:hypothetical protein
VQYLIRSILVVFAIASLTMVASAPATAGLVAYVQFDNIAWDRCY